METEKHKTPEQLENEKQEKEFPGYPPYPKSEDIFNRGTRDENVDPDDKSEISTTQGRTPKAPGNRGEEELDIPGTELDDASEDIGTEDEENNYYSLGGDNHEDLEEDHDELATGLD